MRRWLAAASVLMVFALSACSGAGMGGDKQARAQVKCPACGYQFDAPSGH